MTAVLATTKSLRTTVDGGMTITFEIAPQDAAAAFEQFGLTGTNVGIARITDDAARKATQQAAAAVSEEPIKPKEERTTFLALKRTAQAAIRCGEPAFWQFLRREKGWDVNDKEGAALAVREICAVQSRAEFNHVPEAGEAWDRLEGAFYAWQHGMH